MINNIYPLAYSIPLEKIKNLNTDKIRTISEMIPGNKKTYIYSTEEEYYKQYCESKYAYTMKKSGWDCLRHYEILACNCIPLFKDLDKCPEKILFNFPKQLLMDVMKNKDFLSEEEYKIIQEKLHNYTKKHLTCEASANYFLNIITKNTIIPKCRILMINNNLMINENWANYSQYMLTIGLRNVLGSNFVDFPKNKVLYKGHNRQNLYGNGFTYSNILDDIPINRENISQQIKNKEFDFIIYGLMGKSEKICGDIRLKTPLWREVSSFYNKDQIIFLYGGDVTLDKQHSIHLRHLIYHSNHGICFVRELNI